MKKHDKYKFDYLFLGRHNYNNCFDIQEDEESDDDKTLENDKEEIANLLCMPFLESDEEEVKEGKGIKILAPKKLLISLSIAQIKAGNNLYKLKNESRQAVCLLYQYNKITKNFCNGLSKSF